MKFVTKDEFDKALAIVHAAAANGQIRFGRYDEEGLEMSTVLFSDSDRSVHQTVVESNAIHFVSASIAAKAKLVSVRKALAKQQEEANKNQKVIESLESQEKKLATVLPTLKE